MKDYMIKQTTLTDIADAIREKVGITGTLDPANYAQHIRTISGALESVSTVEELEAKLTPENLNRMFKFVGESGDNYVNGKIYVVEEIL